MYSIKGTTINLTRGDTMNAKITVHQRDGTEYVPQEGDIIRFALNDKYGVEEPLICKDIPKDTMVLTLDPEDTKKLDFGTYVYDIQLTTKNGDVDTFIAKAKCIISEEVC